MDVGKLGKVTIEEIERANFEGANYNPLKSVAPDQLKIKLPERQLNLDQQLIYNNIMLFVEANVAHALDAGFQIDPQKGERLRIEFELIAETSNNLDYRFCVEVTLP